MLCMSVILFSTTCFGENIKKSIEQETLTLRCDLVSFGKNYFQIFKINIASGNTEISINLAFVDEIKRKGMARLDKNHVNIVIPKEGLYQACDVNITIDSGKSTSACDEYVDSKEKFIMKLQCEKL